MHKNLLLCGAVAFVALGAPCFGQDARGPIKVFLLAGDECVLEEGVVEGRDAKDGGQPGTLATVLAENPRYAFLRDKQGRWGTRDDVLLHDAHPLHNNTEALARPLTAGVDVRVGPEGGRRMGVDLMLGHVLGDALAEPVLIVRFATRHRSWFRRGSRSLAHDYMPPSSGGGGGGEDMSWDVIHFNWGVWDMAYRDPKPGDKWHSDKYNGKLTTTLEDFDKNLRALVAKMKATGATLIWGTITPMHEDLPGRFQEDPARYNAVAARIMQENGVRVNDLNAESIRQGYPKRADVHSTGNLAPKAIEAIEAALADRENPGRPLPRVLLIGDSITGSYQGAVKKHFEGRSAIYKNPGNAEHTGTGLRMIDQWLDTDTYQFSGQEYMELVHSVRKTLDDMERYFLQYDGRPVELAGLIWFQGIADGKSQAKAAEYEEHLANLIRDVCKDLNEPNLPVVVAALANSGGRMTPSQQKVFDAQMAVGDAGQHPEFAGNVISLDTRPMCRPPADCPGGRDRYKGNAASYLEIGEAMGRAMLKLLGRE